MAINRNFLVKQGIQIGLTANAGSTWTSNNFISNKNDILAVPSLTLDFTKGYIDSRLQTIRASSGTYVDMNGLIQVAGNNTPRIEYDPTTGACKGLVSEEDRTNLIAYSDMEGAVNGTPLAMGWPGFADQRPVISTDFWIGPNKQSCKHTRGSNSNTDDNCGYASNQNITATNTWYTWSVYIYLPSNVNYSYVNVSMEGNGVLNPNPTVSADLTIRDRWQRLVGTFAVTTTGAYTLPVIRMGPAGVFCYSDCWQCEAGEYASTWVPTTQVASATRAAEFNYVYPFTPYHTPDNFSLFVEATPKWTSNSTLQTRTNQYGAIGSNRHLVGLDYFFGPTNIFGGSPYNGYAIQYPSAALNSGALSWGSRQYGNTTPGFASSGPARGIGIANTGYDYGTMIANTSIKVAATTNSSAGAIMSSGNISTYANSTMTGSNPYSNNIFTDRLLVGWAQQGGVPSTIFGGNIKKVSYFPRSLSLDELTAITET
jgi:hypothetical protein